MSRFCLFDCGENGCKESELREQKQTIFVLVLFSSRSDVR